MKWWKPLLSPWEKGCKDDELWLRVAFVCSESEVSTLTNSPTSSTKALCTSLTNDRKACNQPRSGWSRFCWHHQPWAEMGLSTVIALLVGVNATWFIALRGSKLTHELADNLSERSIHTQNFDLPSLRSGERVQIGSVSYSDVAHNIVRLGDSEYEIDRSPEGAFSLSGEIRDRGGRNVVAQLKHSRLFVSPGLAYDINADSSAIEVVDRE